MRLCSTSVLSINPELKVIYKSVQQCSPPKFIIVYDVRHGHTCCGLQGQVVLVLIPGFWDQTQAARLAQQGFEPISHCTSPQTMLFKLKVFMIMQKN